MNPCDLPGCTWSEQYRRECEARMVMRMTEAERKAYLDGVRSKRGAANADQVLQLAREEWRKQRLRETTT